MKKIIQRLESTRLGGAIKRVIKVLDELGRKQVGLLAAGIAYYGILAFFPLVVALVALGSLFIQPENMQQAADAVTHLLPSSIANLLIVQLQNAEGHHLDNLFAALVATIVSIVSIMGAVGSMMGALNIMYEKKERRSFVRQKMTSLVLAVGVLVMMLLMIPLLFVSGNLLAKLGLTTETLNVLEYMRWLVIVVVMMLGLAVLYHVGPSHAVNAKWHWASRGAAIATIAWVVTTAIFFWYIQHIANLSHAYSLFAGVIGMMLWLNISSFIILIGADINRRLQKT